ACPDSARTTGSPPRPGRRPPTAAGWAGRPTRASTAVGPGTGPDGNAGPTAADALDAWVRSPGHQAILIGDWTHIGAASCPDGQGGMFWLADFGYLA